MEKQNKKVIIIGASGHGKVIADIVIKSGDTIQGFLDDNQTGEFVGYPILGCVDAYSQYSESCFVIAIGDANIRERIAETMGLVKWYTAIHPSACISSIDVCIGEGSVVMPNAVVNSGATVGRHCIINSGAIVEHDNTIEDYVHISVGAKLGGGAKIGRKTWIGVGANVRNYISICNDCMIGMGATVVKTIEEPGVYIGTPAKGNK